MTKIQEDDLVRFTRTEMNPTASIVERIGMVKSINVDRALISLPDGSKMWVMLNRMSKIPEAEHEATFAKLEADYERTHDGEEVAAEPAPEPGSDPADPPVEDPAAEGNTDDGAGADDTTQNADDGSGDGTDAGDAGEPTTNENPTQ